MIASLEEVARLLQSQGGPFTVIDGWATIIHGAARTPAGSAAGIAFPLGRSDVGRRERVRSMKGKIAALAASRITRTGAGIGCLATVSWITGSTAGSFGG
jgi:hypothetical protein